jgi:uncharacterized cupin superfamily protein
VNAAADRATADVLILVVGDRTAGDGVSYPDIGLQGRWGAARRDAFARKDGTPLRLRTGMGVDDPSQVERMDEKALFI